MEKQGLLPIPIFINGVEAHTIVRDLLTSTTKEDLYHQKIIKRESTYQPNKAVQVDAVVNSIGFPLVGGPAGSMEAGRNVHVAQQLLKEMNVPYIIASPLLLQSIPQWKQSGVLGLQAVVLYALPELDGAIDTVVLGGLVGDKIALIPERVRKLTSRLQSWITLRRTPPKDRKLSVVLYGFPPNVGAVGTAALLDVPQSLEKLLKRLHEEGYDVGDFATDPDACGQSLVAALSVLSENPSITGGASRMESMLEKRMVRAKEGDVTTAECLARPGGGLGGAKVQAQDVSSDELEKMLGKYMFRKVRRAWSEKDRGPGVSGDGKYVVAGLQVGNVFVTVQPLLGVEGDPMRLLFERNLTPHPQYCAAYEYMKENSQAVIHLGMHGTAEWLPGQVRELFRLKEVVDGHY
jgi:magnesium chelatase subunit H